MKRAWIILIVIAILFVLVSPANADNGRERFMVQAPDGIILLDKNVIIENYIEQLDTYVITAPRGYINKYKKLNSEWYVEEDGVCEAIFVPNFVPNDELYSQQWGMSKIEADLAWDITVGDSSTIIAILDTGIDNDHSDLLGKVVHEENFSDSTTVDDMYGHGTHCAGIAAAITDNNLGVAGVGFDCSLANFKVLNDYGTGLWSWAADAIVTATDYGVDVISMSFGGSSYSYIMEQAIDYAWNHGVVLVAAAGNTGIAEPHYPAFYDNVLSVAATDNNDMLTSFSTYGDWVDVAAPGYAIWSTYPAWKGNYNGYRQWSGTSMACPHVAGLAGLLDSITEDGNDNGRINDEVRDVIETTTDDLPEQTKYIINGRINAYDAVRAVQPPTPPPSPPPTPPARSIWLDQFSVEQKGNSSTIAVLISVIGEPTLPRISTSFAIEITKDGELIDTLAGETHFNKQDYRGKLDLISPGVYIVKIIDLVQLGYTWNKECGVPLSQEIIIE